MKVPSTPLDSSTGVIQGITGILDAYGMRPDRIARFIHGTTVPVNAVIQRTGAKIGIVTTAGFKDTLEIGRQIRHAVYDAILEPEVPSFLAPGALRKEVTERISSTGEILVPLDEESVRTAVKELAEEGVTSIAVCLLFSFLNPVHEVRIRELIGEMYPAIMTSVSHEVDPAFREYERTVVTGFDAYIKPVVDNYLENLELQLSTLGTTAPLEIMQSRGGTTNARTARKRPVRLFLSGPAAGVIGGRMVGDAVGVTNLITVDIGGTSCDIALVSEGKPVIRSEGVIAGFPVRVPMVDVNAIGSGGGSIAWLDPAGSLRVGPRSAGSEPGPACYGRGGKEPTVTDASVVLGYINPTYFAGGSLNLNPELAHQSIQKLAGPLGLTVEETALGIHKVLTAQMAEGIRLVSIRQGFDPRGFTLLPLGGGGPVHATALARELDITSIVVPRFPGVLSAMGLLAAAVEHEVSAAFPSALSDLNLNELRKMIAVLDDRCSMLMRSEAVSQTNITIRHFADVCYDGQSYHLEVPLSSENPLVAEKLYGDFLEAHDSMYGHRTRAPARIVNLRTVHQGKSEGILNTIYQPNGNESCRGSRKVLWAEGRQYLDTTIYEREALRVGQSFLGPAVVEQADTTLVVEPGWECEVKDDGSILVSRPSQKRGH